MTRRLVVLIAVVGAVGSLIAWQGPWARASGAAPGLTESQKLSEVNAAQGSSPSPGGVDETAATAQVLTALHGLIDGATDSSDYAGVIDNPATQKATAYVTTAGLAPLEQALSQAGDQSLVDVVTVSRSYAQLTDLTTQLDNDMPAIGSAGIDAIQWGPDIGSNSVSLEVTSDVATAQAYMNATYGAGLVTVSAAKGPPPEAVAGPPNRYADVSPWYNGDRIYIPASGEECTSGFSYRATVNRQSYGLTAGHCGSGGVETNENANYVEGSTSTNYFNADVDAGNKTTGPLHLADVQSFTCTSCAAAGVTYTDGPNDSTVSTVQVSGNCTSSCAQGDFVTTDGATTGPVSDNEINKMNQCVTFPSDGYTDCSVTILLNPAGGPVSCNPGDSGGPVYQRQGSGDSVLANGLVVGTDGVGRCYEIGINLVSGIVGGTIYK